MSASQLRGRLAATVGLAAMAAAACNSILGIEASTYKEAGVDASPRKDGGRDAGKLDASKDSGRDAGFDAGFDAAVEAACQPTIPDAMPEGGKLPDPGAVVCDTYLTKSEGGTCSPASQVCCNVNAPRPAFTSCIPPEGSCLGDSGSPATCDEAADCSGDAVCCFALNAAHDYVQVCGAATPNGGCSLGDSGPLADFNFSISRVCKRNEECGPCGTCQVFCCPGPAQIERCTNPFPSVCTVGPCGVLDTEQNDGVQDFGETDIDCGGSYAGGTDQANACGGGYKCKLNTDCTSDVCLDGGTCAPINVPSGSVDAGSHDAAPSPDAAHD